MTAQEDNVRARQDGDYEPPVLAEPVGGPIPPPGGEPRRQTKREQRST